MILKRDKDGSVKKGTTASTYNPSEEVKKAIQLMQDDFQHGHTIMHKPRQEFGGLSVIEYYNKGKRAFNSYVPPRSTHEDEAWRAQTVRPITRNKLISTAAHVTAAVLLPMVKAQNDQSEEDRDAALVMRDLIQWVVDNSDYEQEYLYGIIAALYSPATILESRYVEVLRTIKLRNERGEITKAQIIDELMSGFNMSVVPVDELYISNFYERNIQKQRFLIRRELVWYEDAKAEYGSHPDFRHVPNNGSRHFYVPEEDTFYNEQDHETIGQGLVEKITYYNRADDLKLVAIAGILVTAPDNPNPRIDKQYPYSKTFFEPFDEGKCFYGKHAADRMSNDQEVADTMYNMVLDAAYLSLMPPMAHYGQEEIGSAVVVPGAVTSLSPDSKLEAIKINSDIRAGMEALSMVERSIDQSSSDPIRSGQTPDRGATAYELSLVEKNAIITLGLFGKMIRALVEDYTDLLIGDILQHMSTAKSMETMSDGVKLKFQTFLLPDQVETGRTVTKKIQFSDDLADELELKSPKDISFELYDKEMKDGKDDTLIYLVNPSVFRKLRFRVTTNPEELEPTNKQVERALNLEAYDRMIQNQFVDQEAITREFLVGSYRPGESDKYMAKNKGLPDGGAAALEAAQGTAPRPKGVNGNLTGQLTGSNSLANANVQR